MSAMGRKQKLAKLDRARIVTSAYERCQSGVVHRYSNGETDLFGCERFDTSPLFAVFENHPIKQSSVSVVKRIPETV